MPRIAREDHATIRHRVDVEGHKVADVAAAYGCTPANIYAILAKLRRQEPPETGQAVAATSITEAQAADAASADLLSALTTVSPVFAPLPAPPEHRTTAAVRPTAPPATPPTTPSRGGRREAPAGPGKPAPPPPAGKPGYGLLMRTGEGEEAVHPFRSLEELLSAAKPILRMAARSPEPIWFSIQPLDLEALEDSL